MSRIQFWLSFNNGAERLQLPVNPETVEITSPYGFNDVSVSRLGEYTVIGERLPLEVSFTSFLPRDYNPSYCEYIDIPNPIDVINKLEEWRDSRRPMRLTITGTTFNYAVTLRELDYEPDRAGNPGDIYYSIKFKQFKFLNPDWRP